MERTFFPSFMYSAAEPMVCENIANQDQTNANDQEPPKKKQKKKATVMMEAGKLLRSVKIRIIPTQKQQQQITKIIGISRHIYNECVTMEKDGLINGASTKEMYRVRALLTKKENYIAQQKKWKEDAPGHTMQQAVAGFFTAKKAAYSNLAANNIDHFQMRYKSKFGVQQETVPFERYKLVERQLQISGVKGQLKIRDKKLPAAFRNRIDTTLVREECKISRTRLGYYYAILTYEVTQKETTTEDICAIDPGVRTFISWYSQNGNCGKIGQFQPQQELLQKADKLQQQLALGKKNNRNYKWRRRKQRQFLRTLERVRNRTDDLHHKV